MGAPLLVDFTFTDDCVELVPCDYDTKEALDWLEPKDVVPRSLWKDVFCSDQHDEEISKMLNNYRYRLFDDAKHIRFMAPGIFRVIDGLTDEQWSQTVDETERKFHLQYPNGEYYNVGPLD